jgi:hypothetical protein
VKAGDKPAACRYGTAGPHRDLVPKAIHWLPNLQLESIIMADTVLIVCPECDKKLRMPAQLQGKRIRCKSCGHAFTARAPGTRDAEAGGMPAKGKKAGAAKSPNPDFERDENPYVVLDTEFAPRCPHCASELENAEARICLHCGYDLRERERHPTKKTYETTGSDYFLWLLPGIACALLVLMMIGFIVFLFGWLGDIAEANKDAWWNVGIKAMWLWGTVFSLAVIFFAGRFAIKRLIFHPVPPEREKS